MVNRSVHVRWEENVATFVGLTIITRHSSNIILCTNPFTG